MDGRLILCILYLYKILDNQETLLAIVGNIKDNLVVKAEKKVIYFN